MRYKVVPHTVAGQGAWAIWDDRLSRDLLDAGFVPYVCSLDGEKPLTFKFLSQGYKWLAACERAGLDMEDEGGFIHVATARSGRGGSLYMSHDPIGTGPVIQEIPDFPLEEN